MLGMWFRSLSCRLLQESVVVKTSPGFTPVKHTIVRRKRVTHLVCHIAYEFMKRNFSKTYGPELPIWALLTSGATGGVRGSRLLYNEKSLNVYR